MASTRFIVSCTVQEADLHWENSFAAIGQ